MNATISVVCYKSKTLSNGEHPLMLRISKDGKKKYQSLGKNKVYSIQWISIVLKDLKSKHNLKIAISLPTHLERLLAERFLNPLKMLNWLWLN